MDIQTAHQTNGGGSVDTWENVGPEWILQSDSIDEEFRPYLGNGYMGVKIAGEGTNWNSDHAHFVADIWLEDLSKKPFYTEKQCATPKWSAIGLNNGERYFQKDNGQVLDYRQVQNLKQGFLRTSCTGSDVGGKDIDIDIVIFISRENSHLGVIRYSIVPRFSGPVHFKCMLDGDDIFYSGYFDKVESNLVEKSKGYDSKNQMIYLHTETSLGIKLGNASLNQIEGIEDSGVSYSYELSKGKIDQTIAFRAEADKRYTLYSFAMVFTSHDAGNPLEAAKQECLRAAKAGWQKAFARHSAKRQDIWKADVIIEGEEVTEDQ